MLASSLEARALALAARKGLLRAPCALEDRLEDLVARGDLDPETRDRLIWEALQEDGFQEGATYPASWTAGAWPGPAEGVQAMETFGPYESLELLGVGGQGRVYRAYDPRLQRQVALKLLRGAMPEAHLREARAQAQVEHRNVCRVYEVGEVNGQPYIALQLIRGRMLGQTAMAPEAAVRLIRDAAEGVHAAHRQGLLHLDLKPSNLLVSEEADPPILYVTDFGLAAESRQTGHGPLGSPPYCAPEQVDRSRAPLDQRTDVYGLGAALYTALTGRPPFQAESLTGLLLQIQERDPVPPSALRPAVRPDLDAILLKAMAKAPEDRYASALAFADDLERWLKGMPILARPSSWIGRAAKWTRRNRAAGLSLATLILLSFGVTAWALRAAAQRRHTKALLQTFSEDMRTLELRLYAMRMLPPEDHRRIEADLRERLTRIEASLGDMGDLAPAGHYALGLGYRSLREWEPSARHFKAAWDAGFRTPDSAEATGIACGILTTVLSQQADAMPQPQRASALARIQREWGEPGREALATYAGTPLETPYCAAIEAYHRKDYDGVFEHCLEAVRRQPWQVSSWRFMLTCAMADPAAAARHGLAPGPDGYSLAVRRLTVTAPGDAVSQDVLGDYWTRSAAGTPPGSEARHERLMRAFAALENARIIEPDEAYPLQRSLDLCDTGLQSEPARAGGWRQRRLAVLASAAQEPALASLVAQLRAGESGTGGSAP